MRFFGGKALLATTIASFINKTKRTDQIYLEPFVGGAWVLTKVDGERIASDNNLYLIAMYKALQNGWVPPENVSEEEWKQARQGNCPDYLRAFIGFGCSFGAKWFGGYGRGTGRNYAGESQRALLAQAPYLKEVSFFCCDYREHEPIGEFIYCDPPYYGAVDGYGMLEDFDHTSFWDCMRLWSKDNIVLVSEYSCPSDFTSIWSKLQHVSVKLTRDKRDKAMEHLFCHQSQIEIFEEAKENAR